MTDAFLYLHTPTPIFRARLNMASATYPITELVFDGVTLGAFGDIKADMTLILGTTLGGDDLGRQRVQSVATSTTIPIMRTSEGVEDGELTIADNAYVEVWDDYRVWSKTPYIDADGIQYKDTNIPVGDHTTNEPPVANCGPGFADFIDGDDVITVEFDGFTSFAVADGATITAYAWDIGDGVVIDGGIDEVSVRVEFPAGFRWVTLTVTDSNDNTHAAHCPVLAVDPADDPLIYDFTAETTITPAGQQLRFTIKQDIHRDDYPDGTLVMFWESADPAPIDRDFMRFIGWEQSNDNDARAVRTGNLRATVVNAVDVAGRLQALPGFPQSLERHATPDNWDKMVNPTMDKYIHYILLWHSTALSLADYTPSGTGAAYPFVIFASEGESLWDQVNNEAKGLIPGYLFTCDIQGRLAVNVVPLTQNVSARTPNVQATFTEIFTEGLRFAYTRPPRVHWLRGYALLTATGYTDVGGVDTLLTVHSISPGDAPGQGVGEIVQSEGLARSQADLNAAKGHEYARLNARYGPISVTPADDDHYIDVQPARLTWVELTITAETAAQRGLTFTTARTLVKEIRRRWEARRTGGIRKSEFTLEVETVGAAAVTVLPEGNPPAPEFTPPAFGDPSLFYGEINAYLLWSGAKVARTLDLQAASPTWANITGTVTGSIKEVQYFMADADTCGVWLLSSAGVFRCMDILATTPVWENVLPIATVQAAEVASAVGGVVSQFACMAHYWLQPGHLCVATTLSAEDDNYLHAYFWVTEDYGANWTTVDMDAFTFTSDSATRCYYVTTVFNMECFRSAPTLFCLRSNGRTGIAAGNAAVFKSTDGGYTWTKEYTTATNDPILLSEFGSLLHPFPAIGDPCYIGHGRTASSQKELFVSADAFATATQTATPAGYTNILAQNARINKRTFDTDHLISLWRETVTGDVSLFETYDQGANWSALLTAIGANYVNPNGWPPDVDQWVLLEARNSTISANTIRLTLDNFTGLSSRTGDLATAITDLALNSGFPGGFALPRVGINA